MHDSIVISTCFSLSDHQRLADEPTNVSRSGQSIFKFVYRTKLVSECRLITITWYKNLLLDKTHRFGCYYGTWRNVGRLSLRIQQQNGRSNSTFADWPKPWYFWRKQGSEYFIIDGTTVDVVWDFKAGNFNGETEPQSDYYKDAYRKTGCRPSLIEPMLVFRREHIFGNKKFTMRVKFNEKGAFHDIYQWYAALMGWILGNESINVGKNGLQVFWDIHDWLFGSGPRHGLFIFNPILSSPSLSMPLVSNQEPSSAIANFDNAMSSSVFCLFLYAWKVERKSHS
ncbi:hypothetical protein ES319_A03G145900v1 [Gossypium barbadense]|uniref:Uncharacterized protein n=1 Tax=Gossypium barbadense TaxID=3634 RepID=A0A5J5WFV8_GOSBA|nr:hypothetical protein ES319_A03G145900v1 [Gossypium barbadense]